MAEADDRNRARMYLEKAEAFLLAAQNEEDNRLWIPAAGMAIHAGISAKDAIATALTCRTAKSDDHRQAVRELEKILAGHPEQARACRALGELIAEKSTVEYTHRRVGASKVQVLVRRAETLVDLTRTVVN